MTDDCCVVIIYVIIIIIIPQRSMDGRHFQNQTKTAFSNSILQAQCWLCLKLILLEIALLFMEIFVDLLGNEVIWRLTDNQ